MVWLLPAPVRVAPVATTGLVLASIVRTGPRRTKLAPPASARLRLVHDVLVGHVAVGEDDPVDLLGREDPVELVLRDDRDARRVERTGELRRVATPGDAGDLGRREGDDLDARVVAVDDVEVVEVAPGGPHDHDLRAVHGSSAPPGRRGNAGAGAGCARARARRRRRRTSRFRPGPGGRPVRRVSRSRQAGGKSRAARPDRDVRAGPGRREDRPIGSRPAAGATLAFTRHPTGGPAGVTGTRGLGLDSSSMKGKQP